MREIRTSGSEGREAGNLTGLPYPYQLLANNLPFRTQSSPAATRFFPFDRTNHQQCEVVHLWR